MDNNKVESFGIRKLSIKDLYKIAEDDLAVVGTVTATDGKTIDTTVDMISLPGGWKCKWIRRPQGAINQGVLILIPTTSPTRIAIKTGQYRHWQNVHGLDQESCDRLWKLQIPYKADIVEHALLIRKRQDILKHYLDHPMEFGIGTRRKAWKAKLDVLVSERFGSDTLEWPKWAVVSAEREVAIAKVIDLLDGNSRFGNTVEKPKLGDVMTERLRVALNELA